MGVLDGQRVVGVIGRVPELAAAELVVYAGPGSLVAHAAEEPLGGDYDHEGKRENDDVEPGAKAGGQQVANGQFEKNLHAGFPMLENFS